MKYESLIRESFAALGFEPRPNQIDAIQRVLEEFVDKNVKVVCLSAPTGAGKSLISAVTAECINRLKDKIARNESNVSITLVGTNALSAQYASTFKNLIPNKKYIMLKGANNYECGLLSEKTNSPCSAEDCVYFDIIRSKKHGDVRERFCENGACQYKSDKDLRNTVRHLTTNYSMYFIDRMYTRKLEDRDLVVFDEAHLVNDLFSDHNTIFFSKTRIEQYQKEIAEEIGLASIDINSYLKQIILALDTGEITDDNYLVYAEIMRQIYTEVMAQAETNAGQAFSANNMKLFSKMSKFVKKYEGLACKIDDLQKYEYDHVFEYKADEKSVTIKPVFVGSMMETLYCGPKMLMMSATIDKDSVCQAMQLNEADVAFVKLAPVFPRENKKVIFLNAQPLSYATLQQDKTIQSLIKSVKAIVKKHTANKERGIILMPSFKLQQQIVEELRDDDEIEAKFFVHQSGTKLADMLSRFKSYDGGPAVLISPAMFEGIDLPGDLSRYQILVKAPFPSLGDKRMKHILDKYPDIYQGLTISKAVQGAGRSVRSITDYATTYCLDKNLQRIWFSSKNVWQDEFNSSCVSYLT